MSESHETRDDVARSTKLQRYWNKKAGGYDRQMGFWERRLFGDSRRWACSQASGEVLEVAIGTGLNLPVYPGQVSLTGIDLSDGMLAIARTRAAELDRPVKLLQGDAHALPFEDAAFDTVVCTFSLCSIPEIDTAVGQMRRVLRPGGRLVLADHIESSSMPVRGLQRLLELFTVPQAEEHFRRRPLNQVRAAGFTVEQVQRFKLGIVERLTARKPTAP
ncbi:class I SAM-dependent methyltransferase [Actinomadura sp. 3N407]|uniref:class I SAM-dependent methyltransferase n=1 Tax=Actinomadura sp. 3N407 TaxID=3457423 RepID=UPI003FCCFD2F